MANEYEGMNGVIPHFVVDGAGKAIELYQRALGAELLMRIDVPGTDKVMHAGIQIGSSMMFLNDPAPEMDRTAPTGLSSAAFYVYVPNVDEAYTKAVSEGMQSKSEPEDMFWGDRTAVLTDGFGYNWTLATFQKEVSPEEMQEAMKNMMPEPA